MAVLNSFFMNFFLGIVAFGLLLILYIKHSRTYWQRRGVNTLPVHWLYGNIKDAIMFKKSPALVLGDLHTQAPDCDVLGFYIFHKPFLLLRNAEIIKQILVRDFNYFPNRSLNARSFQDKIGSSNLFSLDNPEWKYVRSKLSPVFSSGKLKKIFHLIAETSNSLSKYLEEQFSDGEKTKAIYVRSTALKYTTNIISSIAFGVQVNSFDPKEAEFFEKAEAGLRMTIIRGIQLMVIFFFPNLSPYFGGRLLGKSTDYFRKVFWDSLHSRQRNKNKRGDLIDSLIELKDGETDSEFRFEGDALVSQSAVFFAAGRQTSASTICFALYELAKQPDLQKRARDEIHRVLKDQGMTYENIYEMKYIFQILSETLRLYPPAPIIDRKAMENYKIPGTDIVIEKGASVFVALPGLHRDPKYFPNPLQFDPDRFSDENKNSIVPCSYMPFGEGPRICIGMRQGYLQSAVGLITVLKDYEVSVDPTCEGFIEPRNIFVTPRADFRLIFTKI